MRELLRQLLSVAKENNSILKENNKMLKSLMRVTNHYILDADNENLQDFGRNIAANIISNLIHYSKRL